MAREDNTPPAGGSVEGLKKKLYSRAHKDGMQDVRSPLSQDEPDVPRAWEGGEVLSRAESPLRPSGGARAGRSLASKFLIGSIVFFGIALLGAGFVFFSGGNTISAQNIDLQVIAPSLIDSGKPTSFEILVGNRNQTPLELTNLVIAYPPGTPEASDASKTLQHDQQSTGTIVPGAQLKRQLAAAFNGQEGEQMTIKVTLQYTVPGSNAIFEKQTSVDFIIGSSPVSLLVDAPPEATAGDPFDIALTLQSNATTPIENLAVQGQYPFGFSLSHSDPIAQGGSLVRVGELSPGESRIIHLTGMIDGQDGDEKVFRFLVGSDVGATDAGVGSPLLSVPMTLTVRRPFIAASLALEGKSGKSVAVPAGRALTGTITWQNNLPDAVSDLTLSLSLQGPMLDPSTITGGSGFYQSSNSTVIWSKDQDPSLAQVPPGGSGTYQFSFTTFAAGSGGTLYSNPTVSLNLTVAATRAGQGDVPQTLTSAASMQVNLASVLELAAQALHFSGPFVGTGPMPPRADIPTTYTILWSVKNSSNLVANASVAAVVPTYVQFTAARSGDAITYDAGSRTVTWNLGELKPGVGYSLPVRQGAFEVTLTPSASQVGQSPALTGDALLQGQDRFTNTSVRASAPAPTTVLTQDPGYQSSMGTVVPKQ